LLVSCGKNADKARLAVPQVPQVGKDNLQGSQDPSRKDGDGDQYARAFSLEEVLARLDTLSVSSASAKAHLEEIKYEFSRVLKAGNLTRFASYPPGGEVNRVNNLVAVANGQGGINLSWTYKNLGDYNQDGVADVADLAILAEHLFHKGLDGLDEVIDGNRSGEVEIADVAPLAENLFSQVVGYAILGTDTYPGGEFTELTRVYLTRPEKPERLRFSVDLENVTFRYFAVQPFDGNDIMGDISNVVTANSPPNAVLNATPSEGKAPLTVNFDASQSSDADGSIIAYEWDFNGDGSYEKTTVNPTESYTYTTDGVFNASVRVTDDFGASDVASATIVVGQTQNAPPVARLTANPRQGNPPLLVNFDASASSDSDGTIILYEWDWEGDNIWDDSTSQATRSHIYEQGGDFRATVRVTDNLGLQATATVTINVAVVANKPPNADLKANPTDGLRPLAVSFDASGSSDPEGRLTAFHWDFNGDGTNDRTTTTNTTNYTYNTAGIYNARVTVEDDGGLTDFAIVRITVREPPPPTYIVSGTVTDSDGGGLEGVTLSLEPGGFQAFTNANGYFEIRGVTNGDYTLTPTKAGYEFAPPQRAVTVAGADVTGQDFSGTLIITSRTWGGSADDVALSLATSQGGNLFLSGWTASFGAGGDDALVLAYSSSASLLWAKTFGGSQLDRIYACATSGTNLFAVGETQSFGFTDDLLVLRYSDTGALSSAKSWDLATVDVGYGATVDASGSLYVVGRVSYGVGNSDLLLLKYLPNGTLGWQITWGGDMTQEEGRAVVVDASGNVYLAGKITFGVGNVDALLLKFNSAGDLLWVRNIGDAMSDAIYSLALDASGNIWAVGETENFGSGGLDIFLLKVDTDGNLLFARTWGEAGDDTARSIVVSPSEVQIAGSSTSFGSGSEDVLVSFDLDGNLLGAKAWGLPSDDFAYALALDASGSLFIAGASANNSGTWTDVTGQTTEPSPAVAEPMGNLLTVTGTESDLSGTETSPTGTEDTGGGGLDFALVLP